MSEPRNANMDETAANTAEESTPPVRVLTEAQRRVLGVLVEKGFTTPEYYPLTLKAVTAGSNQKSNRHPVTQYSEEAIEETLDELRQLGLVAVVHTESGRTERFRHFARKRFPFNEPQLAVITELLLRGHQQLGELRSRASRMVAIESLDELRVNLQELAEDGYIRSSGPLDRRGIDIDHAFYADGEQPALAAALDERHETGTNQSSTLSAPRASADSPTAEVTLQIQQLQSDMEELKRYVSQLANDLAELRRDLGA